MLVVDARTNRKRKDVKKPPEGGRKLNRCLTGQYSRFSWTILLVRDLVDWRSGRHARPASACRPRTDDVCHYTISDPENDTARFGIGSADKWANAGHVVLSGEIPGRRELAW